MEIVWRVSGKRIMLAGGGRVGGRSHVPGVPKKSIPKIKVFYKKSWSGIKSKPYCLNTLEGLDLIL